MSKELVISASPHETRVAIVEDGQLCEIYIEREKEFALVGSLYKGKVTRVLPGMQSAFVDIGLDSDAFLYVSDFLENLEDYDHVVQTVENKVQKMEQQGGAVFGTPAGDAPATEPAISPAAEPIPIGGSGDAGESSSAAADTDSASESRGNVFPAPAAKPFDRPREHRPDRPDRGRGGSGDRGGRGGRQRRWGRGGGRDRQQGRDLPPSKYASPRPFDRAPGPSRPQEASSYQPPPADYEPVILPGESLAKYKDRVPAAGTADASAPSTPETAQEPQASSLETSYQTARTGLPESLYAPEAPVEPVPPPFSEPAPAVEPVAAAQPPAALESGFTLRRFTPQQDASGVTTPDVLPEQTASDAPETQQRAELSDDEVSALAEQLAEAKHEEAQASVEQQTEAQEAALEPFVEAAELTELQEAMEDEVHEQEGNGQDEELHAGEQDEHDEMQHDGESAQSGEELQQGQETMEPQPGGERPPVSARISDSSRARFQRPMRRGNNRQRGGRPGGRPQQNFQRRPASASHSPTQHRRPQLISEMLKAGQEIIVQIAKEPLGKKGARITSHVALPGRFLVYMPTVDHIGVSRRIGSAEDRAKLRRVVTEAKGTFPGGFIVRTAASTASEEEIRTDVEFLGRTWDTIRSTAEGRHAPSLLHRDLNLVERILRDYLSDDYTAIWIDNEEEFSKVAEFVGRFQPKMVGRVKLYTKEAPIFEEFGIQQELDKALRPKVWLKSGGYIVINHTEALVAIDVNTGKFVGRGSIRLEDTIVKTNLEAVKEIVRQIRLRDLGGIIVVDFIDMEERRNRDKVMAALDQALNQDRAPSKALSFNEFGLVAITRKRTKQALERVLCQPCPYCTGSGMVKSVPTICYEIQAEARKMAADLDAQSVTLRVNPEIAKALKTRESTLIEELEQATRKNIIIQSDPTLHWEQYDIY